MTWTVPSPAKINRFLHITGRREDGYHLLQTGFQFLSVGDTLTFTPNETGVVTLSGMPEVSDNLIIKAAEALKPFAHPHCGAHIHIQKRIPIGAGLGGGSSNAATTLLVLNTLWSLALSSSELHRIGLTLGADVPIFIFGHSGIAEGIGEKLTSYFPPQSAYLVLLPPVPVMTGAVYQVPELVRNHPILPLETLQQDEVLGNAFEPIVRRHFPAVEEAFGWLSSFGTPKLSGSGSAVFLSCKTLDKAADLLAQCPPHWSGFVAEGRNESPLFKTLCFLTKSASQLGCRQAVRH